MKCNLLGKMVEEPAYNNMVTAVAGVFHASVARYNPSPSKYSHDWMLCSRSGSGIAGRVSLYPVICYGDGKAESHEQACKAATDLAAQIAQEMLQLANNAGPNKIEMDDCTTCKYGADSEHTPRCKECLEGTAAFRGFTKWEKKDG